MAAIAYPTLRTAPRLGGQGAGPRSRVGTSSRPARPGRTAPTQLQLVGTPRAAQPAAQPARRSSPGAGRGPAPVRRPAPSPLRRWLPGATTLAVLVACWFGAGALAAGGGGGHLVRLPGSRPVRGGYAYVVRPGDTLWSLAAELEPGGDPRPLMDRLSGQLHDGELLVGQVLVVP